MKSVTQYSDHRLQPNFHPSNDIIRVNRDNAATFLSPNECDEQWPSNSREPTVEEELQTTLDGGFHFTIVAL